MEDDLARCFRYVEPLPEHDNVHSEEFAKIILLASSEFENVLKEFQTALSIVGRLNINEYYVVISGLYNNVGRTSLTIPIYSVGPFTPLSDWNSANAPKWWNNGYNKIKHDRQRNPRSASLRHAVDSLASLQIVLLHLYRYLYNGVVLSGVLAPKVVWPEYAFEKSTWGGGSIFGWRLPDDPEPEED